MYKALKTFSLIIIFTATIFVGHVSSQIKKQCFSKVTIEYENFATSTAENVRCEYFKATFQESIKMIEVTDKDELKLLSSCYKKFTVTEPKKSVDIRVLVKFQFKNFTDEYCMDRFGNFVGCKTGKSYSNEILAAFIKNKCAPRFK